MVVPADAGLDVGRGRAARRERLVLDRLDELLAAQQRGVAAAQRHQLGVASLLHDAPRVEDEAP